MIVIAPKTYMILFIDSKDYKIYFTLKSKGIPHVSQPHLHSKKYRVSKEEEKEALGISDFLEKRSSTKKKYDKVKLKEWYYITTFNDKKKVYSCITWKNFMRVSKGEANIQCIFGGMIRKLNEAMIEDIGIGMDYLRRNLAGVVWWKKGKRNLQEGEFISTPLGFE